MGKVKAVVAGVKKENAKRADDVEGKKEKEPKLDKASKPDEKRREEKRREEKEKDKKDKKDKDKDAPAPMANVGKAKTVGDVKVVIKDKVNAVVAGVKKGNAKRADDVEGEKEKEPKLDKASKASKPDEKRREEKRRDKKEKDKKDKKDKDKDAPAPMAKIGKAETAGDVKVVIKDKVNAGVKNGNAKRADDVEGEKEKEPKLDKASKASKPYEKRRKKKRREEKEKDKKDKK